MPPNRAARRILMALAIVAGVQDGVARAARLVGVDERRDRIVEIDTATGSVDTVVAGDDVRADQIVWSPDESFAYLLASQRDEVLVFDPATERIIERIAVTAPTQVVFHPTEPRAYVQGCGVMVLDTNDHRIVDSFPAWAADYLVLSQSGRWLYGVSDYGYVWVRDLWLSVSYDGSFWEMDLSWNREDIFGAAAAFSSDALVVGAEHAVWTFDPVVRELRRFPYRGAGMAFAMAPQSDVAIVVTNNDLARINLITGATEVRALDPPLWTDYPWNYEDRAAFSVDGGRVLLFQGDRLVAHDTTTLDVIWEAELQLGYYRVLTATETDVLLYPPSWWWLPWYDETGLLVRTEEVTAELEGAHWRDAAWRQTDRSIYVLGGRGLERVDPASASRTGILVDLRPGDIALAGDTAFAVARSDGTLRAAYLDGEGLSSPLAEAKYWHVTGAPLAVDPEGERLYAVSESGLAVYDATTGELVEQLSVDEVGIDDWGAITSLTVLNGDLAVLGFGDNYEGRAMVAVVDVADHAIVVEHQLAQYGSRVWVTREQSGDVALAGTGEDVYSDVAMRPVVARIARVGLLHQWEGELSSGRVVGLAAGSEDGVAFVATANDRIGVPHVLQVVDIAAGEVIAVHQLGGRLNALASDAKTVYAAIAAEPSLGLFDARSGAPLGFVPVDIVLTQVEVASGDARHGDLLDAQLPSQSPPPGIIVAASGENADITVWFDDQRFNWVVPGTSYDEKVAFGADGVLYAGAQRYRDGYYVVVLEPLSGNVLAEIRLDGAPGNILPTPDGELVFVETRFASGSGLSVIEAANNRLIHELRPRGDWLEPAMTPDGAYIVARDGDSLAVLDTRSATVTHYPFEAPTDAIAATAAGAHYLGADGSLHRIDLETGDASVAGEPLVPPGNWSKLAGGHDKLIAHVDGGCAAELVSADAPTGVRRDTLSTGSAASMFSTVSAAGDYALTGYSSQVDIWDLRDGHLVSRLVRPEGFDGGNLVWSIATGCLENCPAPPPAPDRVRWDLLPSATPTATPLPTATPTPDPDPPVEQPGVWLEVDTAAAVAGDVIDIAIHRNYQYGPYLDVTGFQLDLWLPEGVQPRAWRAGEPDCGFTGDRNNVGDPYSPYRSAVVFLPEGCDPAVDCRGFRVLVTAESRLESWPPFVCRARIDDSLTPGSYPMAVDNLYLATEPQSDRLQAVVGDIHVLADRRAATPTPDMDLEYYGPTPAPIPKLLLHGRGVETTAGWTSDIEFKLSGSALAPPRGDLRVVVAMGHPLHPAVSDSAARCRRNPELSNGGSFELWPEGCATTGDCSAIAAWIKVDPGFVGFDSGDPPRWYFRPDEWLFRCDIEVDEDAEDGQYYIRLADASLDGRPVSAPDVLVDAFVPWFTPTATATATPQPSPRLTPRPCVAEEGKSIVCIDDLEADAGDTVGLTVHYRSGGLEQAGVAFEIDPGEAFVPVIKGHGAIGDNRGPCRVNPEIDKNGSAFAYYGEQILALILALDNVDPLPDDVRLVKCTLDVVAGLAPGEYEIGLSGSQGSDPDGNELPVATRNGYLRIRGEVAPSTTPTPARETPTATTEPTSTPQANTRDIEAVSGDSGCQVTEPRINDWTVALLLMLPPVLWLRRCSAAKATAQR